MAQRFIGCDREQSFLMPPDVRDWLPEGHFAWFVLDTVAAVDLAEFYAAYREEIFSTKGAEKRKQHGSKGSTVFRDPNEEDRVWVVFDWDAEGWKSFVSDPDVPPILQEAGHKGRPQALELGGQYDA
jgi:hypothetical protein